MRVAVLGATGYVGSRLVPRLLDSGHVVRCVSRDPAKLDAAPWRDRVESASADALDPTSLPAAFRHVDVVYYLVHGLHDGDFADRDDRAAEHARTAAVEAGVGHLVYLGGLADDDDALRLSPHLWSRQAVGRLLAGDPRLPVTELRASIILGAGSASFELLRSVLETLPVIPDAPWLGTPCQPVAIGDVLDALVQAGAAPRGRHRIVDVVGPDVVAYRDLIDVLADVLGRRVPPKVRVPFTDAPLAGLAASLVTPLPRPLVQSLVTSLANPTVAEPTSGHERLPADPLRLRTALERASRHATPPADPAAPDPAPHDPAWAGPRRFEEVRERSCRASAEALWSTVVALGGDQGWHGTTLLWRLRGALDRALGGHGLRRGRPQTLRPGDVVDSWRVEAVAPRTLVLRSEMRLPGQALLTFEVESDGACSRLIQRTTFEPDGLAGHAYWYATLAAHTAAMAWQATGIVRAAERAAA